MYKKLVLISISKIQSLIIRKKGVKELYGASWLVKEFILEINKALSESKLFTFSSILNPPEKETGDPSNFILGIIETGQASEEKKVEAQIRDCLKDSIKGMPEELKELQLYIAVTDLHKVKYEEAYNNLLMKIQASKMNRLSGQINWLSFGNTMKPDMAKAPSTSTIASNEWRSVCDPDGQLEHIKNELKKTTKPSETYEEIYYKEDLERYCNIKGDRTREKLLNQARQVKKQIKSGDPSSYYALIKIDIDDLGKILSGDDFIDCKLEKFQEKLNKKLNLFTSRVREYLKKNGLLDKKEELTIYMGGDDFLFFSPLNKILKILNEVQNYFREISMWLMEDYGKKITYSTSIILAHRKNPFQQVISESSKQLEEIKTHFRWKKGGTALCLIYRSGNLRSAYLSENIHKYSIYEIISLFHKDGVLSKSFLYSLEREFEAVGDVVERGGRKVFQNEITRIYLRKCGEEKLECNEESQVFLSLADHFFEDSYLSLKKYFDYLHILLKWSAEIISLEGGQRDEIYEDSSR